MKAFNLLIIANQMLMAFGFWGSYSWNDREVIGKLTGTQRKKSSTTSWAAFVFKWAFQLYLLTEMIIPLTNCFLYSFREHDNIFHKTRQISCVSHFRKSHWHCSPNENNLLTFSCKKGRKIIINAFKANELHKRTRSNSGFKYCFRFACQHLNLETSCFQADFNPLRGFFSGIYNAWCQWKACLLPSGLLLFFARQEQNSSDRFKSWFRICPPSQENQVPSRYSSNPSKSSVTSIRDEM